MTTKTDFLRKTTTTPAETLRLLLDGLETGLRDLKNADRERVLAYLAEADQARQILDTLSAEPDTSLTAEETRLAQIETALRKNAGKVVTRVGGATAWQQARPANADPGTQSWWFLDRTAAAQRRRLYNRIAMAVAIILLIFGGVVLLFNTLLKPDPNVILKTQALEQAGEAVLLSNDYEAALAALEPAILAVPNEPELLLFKAVLLREMGDTEAAESLVVQSEGLVENPVEVPLIQAQVYQRLERVEPVETYAQAALEIDPESALGWFLMGDVYAANGDKVNAFEAYQRASTLAEAQGNDALFVLTRIKLGYLSQ